MVIDLTGLWQAVQAIIYLPLNLVLWELVALGLAMMLLGSGLAMLIVAIRGYRSRKPDVTIPHTSDGTSHYKQFYTYRVKGMEGQFATLRETLLALGVKLDDGEAVQWQKLAPKVRNRIVRERVGKAQSVTPVASSQSDQAVANRAASVLARSGSVSITKMKERS